ncbi:chromatin remodeling complex / DNA-dep ATPase [Galdieria sulphuraria]|uniref:Chromatin remodeling complex / DNA-dep ATPase n=1 Tax=Galdieria sulphuraria TaxID=130081 RepID=M2WTJ2_GALSU|nr:chromatin remodeling complex / DNA-dep ATPase [Galdieria sulphuraria]EME27220.1 chromatin remodeling complex / DNA-dep ATPase [Galdieria sulphuraria]|eukprot:XP_005703740.1 chromatin remodeling complex / DNA-dep ATPase [Galdieria sulphuraria]
MPSDKISEENLTTEESQTFEWSGNKYKDLEALLDRTFVYTKFVSERLKQGVLDETSVHNVPDQETGEESSKDKYQQNGKRKQKSSDKVDGVKKLRSIVREAELAGKEVNRVEVLNPQTKQPALVTGGILRDYQLAGVEWIISLYENGLNGILADEMGLGKTVQAIAFLCHLKQMGVHGPFLIVGPLSVLNNWQEEFSRFCPTVGTLLYHGSKEERTALRKKYFPSSNFYVPVIITSYEMIMRDKKYLSKLQWKYLIVDEGHRIKNMNCQLLRELKSYFSSNRLLITGTPLQNDLSELWSLLNFLLPEVFDNLDSFKSWFDFGDDLEKGALELEYRDAIVSKLHRILRPFILRRMKTDVSIELPKKTEIYLYTFLSERQNQLYQAICNGQLFNTLKSSANSFQKRLQGLQNVLMQLRKCCNHPYLFEEPDENFDEKGKFWKTTEDLVTCVGKLQLLDRLLPKLKKYGHQILLYSQMTRMLDILEDYLCLRGYVYCRIDGSTSFEDRQDMIRSFNSSDSDIFIFLLSTRAGGLGINLVAADTVIFYDSDFNPQVDLQAMDRCHRIGQTREVHVYRLVSAGTIEEILLLKANNKRKLEKLVVASGKFRDLNLLEELSSWSGENDPSSWLRRQNLDGSKTVKHLEEILSAQPADRELGKCTTISDDDLEQLVGQRSCEKTVGNGFQIFRSDSTL